jgi:hypothetical protein
MLVFSEASAQGRTDGKETGIWGLVLLYLVLCAVGLVGIMLRQERVQLHIRAIRNDGRVLFWRGFAITLIAFLLVLFLVALGESVKRAGDERMAGLAGLAALMVALTYLVMVLLSFGSIVAVIGDSVAHLFGWRDLAVGWCVLLGSAVAMLVVWIPVFGWALGIYWLSLGVGGLWSRATQLEGE